MLSQMSEAPLNQVVTWYYAYLAFQNSKKDFPDFLCVIRQTLDKYTWKLGVFRKLFLSAYWEGPKPFKNAIKEQIICTTYYR